MVKISLFKNGELVLAKNGKLLNNDLVFENIVYNIDNCILTREDASFKYELDFKNETSIVILKEQDYILNLIIKVKSKIIRNNYHKISYTIESENLINNELEVIFD